MFVTGSVARGYYSITYDIDLILITENDTDNNFEESQVNGFIVEIKKDTVAYYENKMKDDPIHVW